MSISVAEYGGGKIPGYNTLRQADRRTQPAGIKANCSESQGVERARPQIRRGACLPPISLCCPKVCYVKLFDLDFLGDKICIFRKVLFTIAFIELENPSITTNYCLLKR